MRTLNLRKDIENSEDATNAKGSQKGQQTTTALSAFFAFSAFYAVNLSRAPTTPQQCPERPSPDLVHTAKIGILRML